MSVNRIIFASEHNRRCCSSPLLHSQIYSRLLNGSTGPHTSTDASTRRGAARCSGHRGSRVYRRCFLCSRRLAVTLVIYAAASEERVTIHVRMNAPVPDSLTWRPESGIEPGRLWTESFFHLLSRNDGSPFGFSCAFLSLNAGLTCVKM